jgi:DNA helicase-2/ATP-dependent DNA helicase PcrA
MAYRRDAIPYSVHARTLLASRPPLVIYDVETTGLDELNVPAPRIWELAAVRRDGQGRVEASRIVNCGMPIPAAANVAGVDPELPLKEGADPREVLIRFATFLDGAVLVGHNITGFDNAILVAEYVRHGLVPPAALTDIRRCVDTLNLSRSLFPKDEPGSPARYGLGAMAEHLGIPVDGTAHRALADVLVCEKLFDALAARL